MLLDRRNMCNLLEQNMHYIVLQKTEYYAIIKTDDIVWTNHRKGNQQLTWETSHSHCSDLNRISGNLELVGETSQAKKG